MDMVNGFSSTHDPNFSSPARLEVPEKFLWWVGWGGVCKVIFVSNPTVVLRLGWGWGWGFDNFAPYWEQKCTEVLLCLWLTHPPHHPFRKEGWVFCLPRLFISPNKISCVWAQSIKPAKFWILSHVFLLGLVCWSWVMFDCQNFYWLGFLMCRIFSRFAI